jgi:hypothetical protein
MNIEEARNISNEILENYQISLKVPSNKGTIQGDVDQNYQNSH